MYEAFIVNEGARVAVQLVARMERADGWRDTFAFLPGNSSATERISEGSIPPSFFTVDPSALQAIVDAAAKAGITPAVRTEVVVRFEALEAVRLEALEAVVSGLAARRSRGLQR